MTRVVSLLLPARRAYTVADVVVYLLGVTGLSFAITAVWLGMRSVMDIGGSCGSGGPYRSRWSAPRAST